jgi:hypothetical protein
MHTKSIIIGLLILYFASLSTTQVNDITQTKPKYHYKGAMKIIKTELISGNRNIDSVYNILIRNGNIFIKPYENKLKNYETINGFITISFYINSEGKVLNLKILSSDFKDSFLEHQLLQNFSSMDFKAVTKHSNISQVKVRLKFWQANYHDVVTNAGGIEFLEKNKKDLTSETFLDSIYNYILDISDNDDSIVTTNTLKN